MKRNQKIALLSKAIAGTLTSKEVADLRKLQEPIHLTMNLGEDGNPLESDDPTYHIDVYTDGTTKCYDKYQDGRVVYRTH